MKRDRLVHRMQEVLWRTKETVLSDEAHDKEMRTPRKMARTIMRIGHVVVEQTTVPMGLSLCV
jgi:hypothetical protein